VSLRTRILLATSLLVVLPLVVLSLGVRRQVARRLAVQYEERVETLAGIIDEAFALRGDELARGLAALKAEMRADPRLRLAVVDGVAAERPYLLDYAGRGMALLGFDLLRIQDAAGRILSSGHFRAEFDRSDPVLPGRLAGTASGAALVTARRAEGPFLVLARIDSLRLGGEALRLVGGLEVTPAFLRELAGGSGLAVAIVQGDGGEGAVASEPSALVLTSTPAEDGPSAGDYLVTRRPLGLVTFGPDGGRQTATVLLAYPRAPLAALLARLDLGLAMALLGTTLGSLVLALWLSQRISRPIRELAGKAGQVDLDRLDVDFSSGRRDEVGALSRLLGEMTARLGGSARRLREAERRATLGELARQVTHDIRNGFTPLRNVIAHFSQVAREEPERLAKVYEERRGTLESGLDYLETLSGHYSRLTPRSRNAPCNLNDVAREILQDGLREEGVEYRRELAGGLPALDADPTSLRRIAENLLHNARESLPAGGGVITLRTRRGEDGTGAPALVLEVEDTGCGIAAGELDRVFEDFYSSKPGGSGLGLSIVRRLAADLGGSVKVESEPERGSRFTVVLPIATEVQQR